MVGGMANLAGDGPLDGVGLLHGDDLLHGHSNVADLQKASSREVEGLWMTVAGENLVVATLVTGQGTGRVTTFCTGTVTTTCCGQGTWTHTSTSRSTTRWTL